MAAGKKDTTTLKDIIQIVVFLAVTGLLITFYVAYPLNRTAALFGRENLDNFNPDSLPPNDPSLFSDLGLTADTFSLRTDGLTTIAALYLPVPDSIADTLGTIILSHDERLDRASMLPLTRQLSDLGYLVVTYDQRATGYSGGKYHGDGFFEASDMAEIIAWLDIRGKLKHPLVVVGFSLGADAALIAARSEDRIDGVVAVEPYLSTDRRLTILKKEHGSIGIPFFKTVMWWWYDLRSGYESRHTTADNLEAAGSPTLILAGPDSRQSKEYTRLAELSKSLQYSETDVPDSDSGLIDEIVRFTTGLSQKQRTEQTGRALDN